MSKLKSISLSSLTLPTNYQNYHPAIAETHKNWVGSQTGKRVATAKVKKGTLLVLPSSNPHKNDLYHITTLKASH
jgi:hypothetical protein